MASLGAVYGISFVAGSLASMGSAYMASTIYHPVEDEIPSADFKGQEQGEEVNPFLKQGGMRGGATAAEITAAHDLIAPLKALYAAKNFKDAVTKLDEFLKAAEKVDSAKSKKVRGLEKEYQTARIKKPINAQDRDDKGKKAKVELDNLYTLIESEFKKLSTSSPVPAPITPKTPSKPTRVVIVGAGPVGLFAAIKLLESGYANNNITIIDSRGEKDLLARDQELYIESAIFNTFPSEVKTELITSPHACKMFKPATQLKNYCFSDGALPNNESTGYSIRISILQWSFIGYLNHVKGFGKDKYIFDAPATLDGDKVTYTDAYGSKQKLEFDTLIIASGDVTKVVPYNLFSKKRVSDVPESYGMAINIKIDPNGTLERKSPVIVDSVLDPTLLEKYKNATLQHRFRFFRQQDNSIYLGINLSKDEYDTYNNALINKTNDQLISKHSPDPINPILQQLYNEIILPTVNAFLDIDVTLDAYIEKNDLRLFNINLQYTTPGHVQIKSHKHIFIAGYAALQSHFCTGFGVNFGLQSAVKVVETINGPNTLKDYDVFLETSKNTMITKARAVLLDFTRQCNAEKLAKIRAEQPFLQNFSDLDTCLMDSGNVTSNTNTIAKWVDELKATNTIATVVSKKLIVEFCKDHPEISYPIFLEQYALLIEGNSKKTPPISVPLLSPDSIELFASNPSMMSGGQRGGTMADFAGFDIVSGIGEIRNYDPRSESGNEDQFVNKRRKLADKEAAEAAWPNRKEDEKKAAEASEKRWNAVIPSFLKTPQISAKDLKDVSTKAWLANAESNAANAPPPVIELPPTVIGKFEHIQCTNPPIPVGLRQETFNEAYDRDIVFLYYKMIGEPIPPNTFKITEQQKRIVKSRVKEANDRLKGDSDKISIELFHIPLADLEKQTNEYENNNNNFILEKDTINQRCRYSISGSFHRLLPLLIVPDRKTEYNSDYANNMCAVEGDDTCITIVSEQETYDESADKSTNYIIIDRQFNPNPPAHSGQMNLKYNKLRQLSFIIDAFLFNGVKKIHPPEFKEKLARDYPSLFYSGISIDAPFISQYPNLKKIIQNAVLLKKEVTDKLEFKMPDADPIFDRKFNEAKDRAPPAGGKRRKQRGGAMSPELRQIIENGPFDNGKSTITWDILQKMRTIIVAFNGVIRFPQNQGEFDFEIEQLNKERAAKILTVKSWLRSVPRKMAISQKDIAQIVPSSLSFKQFVDILADMTTNPQSIQIDRSIVSSATDIIPPSYVIDTKTEIHKLTVQLRNKIEIPNIVKYFEKTGTLYSFFHFKNLLRIMYDFKFGDKQYDKVFINLAKIMGWLYLITPNRITNADIATFKAKNPTIPMNVLVDTLQFLITNRQQVKNSIIRVSDFNAIETLDPDNVDKNTKIINWLIDPDIATLPRPTVDQISKFKAASGINQITTTDVKLAELFVGQIEGLGDDSHLTEGTDKRVPGSKTTVIPLLEEIQNTISARNKVVIDRGEAVEKYEKIMREREAKKFVQGTESAQFKKLVEEVARKDALIKKLEDAQKKAEAGPVDERIEKDFNGRLLKALQNKKLREMEDLLKERNAELAKGYAEVKIEGDNKGKVPKPEGISEAVWQSVYKLLNENKDGTLGLPKVSDIIDRANPSLNVAPFKDTFAMVSAVFDSLKNKGNSNKGGLKKCGNPEVKVGQKCLQNGVETTKKKSGGYRQTLRNHLRSRRHTYRRV